MRLGGSESAGESLLSVAMDRIRALRNPIRHRDWGSREALARWMGRPCPSEEREAELWLGAHPQDPSRVVLGDGSEIPLDRWIERDPVAALGRRVAEAFGGELPFLFKVLAPTQALSIQTHPDALRARRGFAREDEQGVPRDAPQRTYRDPYAKPELICALTRFSALCDFRAGDVVASELRALRLAGLERAAEAAASEGSAAGLARLLELDEPARRALAESAAAAAAGTSEGTLELVDRLAGQHPGDIGILAPLFLNRIELAPGEALFLEAGHVHAYLEGLGVELMGNSDNTLRAALTRRAVDLPEFLAALDPSETAPPPIAPEADGHGSLRYATPANEFELRRFELAGGGSLEAAPRDGPEIWLCTSGEARLLDAQHAASFELVPGAAVWVPASAGRIELRGSGTLHVASVPAPVS
jgi:mannose-6-phosphate isomerase